MAAMPSPEELLQHMNTGMKTLGGTIGYACPANVLAEVCERYQAYDKALALTEVALRRDWRKGDPRPSVHVHAHTTRGRCLAAQGQWKAARASFEAGAAAANKVGYTLLELLALRDLRRTTATAIAEGLVADPSSRMWDIILSKVTRPEARSCKVLLQLLDLEPLPGHAAAAAGPPADHLRQNTTTGGAKSKQEAGGGAGGGCGGSMLRDTLADSPGVRDASYPPIHVTKLDLHATNLTSSEADDCGGGSVSMLKVSSAQDLLELSASARSDADGAMTDKMQTSEMKRSQQGSPTVGAMLSLEGFSPTKAEAAAAVATAGAARAAGGFE